MGPPIQELQLEAEIEEVLAKRDRANARIGCIDREILDLEEEVSELRDDVGDPHELLHGMEWREEKIQRLSEEKYQLLQDIREYERLILELQRELSWAKIQGTHR